MGGSVDFQSEFEHLHPDEQKEVLDFIVFLKARRSEKSRPKRSRPIPIEKDPFVGVWAGREDMADSARWVREARKREWGD